MATSQVKIVSVELASCKLPLQKPIHLGSVPVVTRDYICLRVLTDAGVEGFAIGYRSGSQLFQALSALAPRILGRDALMRQALHSELERSLIPARASYVRAFSMIDIALWDVATKIAQMPLYKALGGLRTEVPAVPVLGFSYRHRPLIDVQREVTEHLNAGETTIKLLMSGNDPKGDSQYIESMTSTFEGELSFGVDVHWSWRSISEAMATCRRIDDLGLAFIEDPFIPQQWRLAGELRSLLRTPIAVGEDVIDAYSFHDVAQNVDILRVDATASGGITAAMNAIAIGATLGREAFPHVFPYLHIHLACAQSAVMAVEYIPEHTGADPVRLLLKDFPVVKNGKLQISDAPGVGCELNWVAVAKHAEQIQSFEET